MNKTRPLAALAVLTLMLSPFAVAQDVSEGTVLKYDRDTKTLVLKDKSVFPLEKMEDPTPVELKPGDHVEIKYDSNEDDGVVAIHSIKVLPK